MISEFKIGNFKAFGPAQTIPLRPITLVFGPNSAGKSSIIQSLLLARHIHDTGNADAYQTTLGGAAVDLGGFAKYVRNRDSSLRTTIQFSCNPSEYGRQFFYLNKFQRLGIKFTISVPNAEVANAKAVIESATILMDDLELLHLIRGEDGQLHFDEATFLDRSFLSRGRFWSSGSLERLGLFRAIFGEPGKLGPSETAETAEEYGLAPSDLINLATAKPSWEDVLQSLEVNGRTSFGESVETAKAEALRNIALTEDENRHNKEQIIKQLRRLKFRSSSLPLEIISSVWIGHHYPEHTQEGNPLNFFREQEESMKSLYATEEFGGHKPPTDSECEASAWSQALRYSIECLIEACGDAVQQSLGALSYLGPLRWIPPRLIPQGEQFDASWAAGGGAAWQRLRSEPELLGRVNRFLQETLHSQYRLRCQNLAPELDAETIALCVKRALESSAAAPTIDPDSSRVAEDTQPYADAKAGKPDFATALQAELRARNSGGKLAELSLVDTEGLAVSHRDVGTGISQLLPVLVNAAGGQNQLIAIEQPELHLHPALQAELGDVFIESALGENKNTFLIETHSEHLILRLLRRIRESSAHRQPAGSPRVLPEDVAILFVQPSESGAVVKHLRVDEKGRLIDPWPGGFFEESFNELF